MPTTKVMGCGGRNSFAVFLPCAECSLENKQDMCKTLTKLFRTTKHSEYHSDEHGKKWRLRNRNKTSENNENMICSTCNTKLIITSFAIYCPKCNPILNTDDK